MKYCIKYYNGSNAMLEADEVIIRFMENVHDDAKLLKYLEGIPAERRVIINMVDGEPANHIKGLIAAQKVHKNITVMLEYATQHKQVTDLYEENIPYFYINGADNYNVLNTFILDNVTDVYIVNDMCFNIKEVSKYCHNHNVRVRVIPNKAQYSGFCSRDNGLTHFWIRPEDEFLYNDYVDVYEFYGNLAKQDVLYRIYKCHRWLGDLGFLIDGLNMSLFSDRLTPHFGEMRTRCKKRCGLGKCDACTAAADFSKELKAKQNFRIRINYPEDYDKEAEVLLLNEDFESKEVNENFSEG